MNRAKALAGLVLPVVVLGAAALVLYFVGGREHQVRTTVNERSRQNETLSATSADATIETQRRNQGASTVTTYTITGRY